MGFPAAVVDCVLEGVVGGYHFVFGGGHDDGVAGVAAGLAADDVFVADVAERVQFTEEVDVVVEVDSSEFLEYVGADEVGAVGEVFDLDARGGLVGGEVVVVFDVGELVDGAGVWVCGVFER